jgi:CDP-4-dehydro-6-deoxyglucose reductase
MATISLANGHCFPAERGSSVLDAALAHGILLEHGCRTGRCGACKARVLAGQTATLREEASLSQEEARDGWILTCAREALTDLALDIGDLDAPAGIDARILPCRINTLERPTPDVLIVRLRLPPTADFAFRAGQYVDVSGPGGIKRSYSIASDMNRPGEIELHIRRVEDGVMSRYWFEQAQANDLLRLHGPHGTFFLRETSGLELVFLATGTGIAPIKSMLGQIAAMTAEQRPAAISLFWGGRRWEDFYWTPDLPELRFIPVLSRGDAGWQGARGYVQEALLSTRTSLSDAAVYACGSDAMVHAARRTLTAAGLDPKRFHADAFVSSA